LYIAYITSHHINKTWFSTDNGPEMNCPPEGICKRAKIDSLSQRPKEGPGSAGPLRGRKRDIYEGGHRVPGIVSYPAEIKTTNLISWETVTTMDFLPTIMEVLNVDRPIEQQSWALDGRSILPLLRNASSFKWRDTKEGPRSLGFGHHDPELNVAHGWGYRFGRWKYVEGSASCTIPDCRKPQLFDLAKDIGERHDLSEEYPDILADIKLKFRDWHESVMKSRREESKCRNSNQLTMPQSFVSATAVEYKT
jgi:arylsulfatase A-like enzyme